jgi:putative transposase
MRVFVDVLYVIDISCTSCRLLKVGCSKLYHRPLPVSVDDLRLMRWLDEQFLKTPFYRARRMVAVMRRDGFVVNRKRVKRLMRVMGIEAIYQKPDTSLGHPAHKVYPYLLRDKPLVADTMSDFAAAPPQFIEWFACEPACANMNSQSTPTRSVCTLMLRAPTAINSTALDKLLKTTTMLHRNE